jgi:hypothetical protein
MRFDNINKGKVAEASLLGPQGAIHKQASADQSDREYLKQMEFKNDWKAKNPGKPWPGYAKAGFNEASYEQDMDHDKVVVIRGVKGVKSTPFRKKFKNMAAYDRWSDSEEASDYEVHDVMNEAKLSSEQQYRLNDLIQYLRLVTDPEYWPDEDSEDLGPVEILNIIRGEFGGKIADQVESGLDNVWHWGRQHRSSGYDDMAWRKNTRITKSGKANKTDVNALKNTMKRKKGSFAKDPKRLPEADDTRMGTITVTSDEERKRRAKAYNDKKAKESVELDEGRRRSSYEVFRSAQAKERNKRYTPPTQAEIDADRKKDEKGKTRPSISTKSINKKMYEALTLDYSRYMRSHGKKPKPGHGMWMFTTTDMGEPAEDDVFQFSGNLADAKRAAAKWAKGKGAYRFYVMEKTVTEDDCQCAAGETTQEQLLDMLENAMISIEQDLESGKLMDAHALQLGENYLVYEELYNKISSGADLGESANQKLDEVDWGTVGNIAMTAAPLLIPGVGVGALAGLAGRAALGALARRGGAALVKRGLEKVAPNLMKRLGQTKIGRGATQVGGQAAMGALNPAADGPDVDRPDSDASAGQDLLGLAAQSGLSSTDLELVKRAAAARK